VVTFKNYSGMLSSHPITFIHLDASQRIVIGRSTILWTNTPSILVKGFWIFGGSCCLHLDGGGGWSNPSKQQNDSEESENRIENEIHICNLLYQRSVNFYQTTWRHILEAVLTVHYHQHSDLQSNLIWSFLCVYSSEWPMSLSDYKK
jgi:hypothetical protein